MSRDISYLLDILLYAREIKAFMVGIDRDAFMQTVRRNMPLFDASRSWGRLLNGFLMMLGKDILISPGRVWRRCVIY